MARAKFQSVADLCAPTLRRLAVALLFAAIGGGGAFAQNGTMPSGHDVFMYSGCFTCHGEMGQGGAGPKLVHDPFLGVTNYAIAKILLGSRLMPTFAATLNDDQVAAVTSYIRNKWGNHFGKVSARQVSLARKKLQPTLAARHEGQSR